MAINKLNGKFYIGQTIHTAKRRWAQHLAQAKGGHKHQIIHHAIRKHGKENFFLHIVDEIKGNSRDANILEAYYITVLNSLAPLGYNNAIPKPDEGHILSVNERENIRQRNKAYFKENDCYEMLKTEREARRGPDSSQYRGVGKVTDFDDTMPRWRANAFHQKSYLLGVFDDEIKAATAYDVKSLELHGERANLNFPENKESYVSGKILMPLPVVYKRHRLRIRGTSDSIYRGVTKDGPNWRATQGGKEYLGAFKTEKEAATAVDIACFKKYGEDFYFNFPELIDDYKNDSITPTPIERVKIHSKYKGVSICNKTNTFRFRITKDCKTIQKAGFINDDAANEARLQTLVYFESINFDWETIKKDYVVCDKKNPKGKRIKIESPPCHCGRPKKLIKSKECDACSRKRRSKLARISKEELCALLGQSSIREIATQYSTTESQVLKRIGMLKIIQNHSESAGGSNSPNDSPEASSTLS